MKFDGKNLEEVLDAHLEWTLCPVDDEKRADFSGANMVGFALPYARLYGANFRGANLFHACFFGAELEKADFTGANLYETDLRRAKLRGAVGLGYIPQKIPSHGAFIAWKLVTLDTEARLHEKPAIVKLRIPEDARRLEILNGECKASKAEVLEIQTIDGKPLPDAVGISMRDGRTTYAAGTVIEVPDYVADRLNEHSPGIFFYLSRDQAVHYMTSGDDPEGKLAPINIEKVEEAYKDTGMSGTPPQVIDYLIGDELKEFAFAMKYLPDDEAAVVVLKAYDHFTPEYVAKKLRKPVEEIEELWDRAKKHLEEIVKKDV